MVCIQPKFFILKQNRQDEIEDAERFLKRVEQGFQERKYGPTPELIELIEKYSRLERIVMNYNRRFGLNDDGTDREGMVDLGDGRLNRMLSLITGQINQLKDEMNTKFRAMNDKFLTMDDKFQAMDQRLKNIEKHQINTQSRFENKFKGPGGDIGSFDAYKPISNDLGQFPEELNLLNLSSDSQINLFSATNVNRYLRFYGLSSEGNLSAKRLRLLQYIGVNVEKTPNLTTVTGVRI
ncbi:uncharacterized protein PRCAT00006317001 [Priceomyces carsonii]|uniref:uncharacterized protein n=1 Tax=Priceomyces carsonii TaxID=28549 RepID=UPI002EDB7AAA|nr:unnamed protein product [Priceomyces carsonii]